MSLQDPCDRGKSKPTETSEKEPKENQPMNPNVVDRTTWLAARRELLAEEKALTRKQDELSARRRALPWVRIDKPYTFETVDGSRTLGQLFENRHQLIIYHFMMGPEWEEGCPSCSFWADNFNGIGPHLAQRDTTLMAVSRSPLKAIETYRKRMGWTFPWASSLGSDFNMDFHVSFPQAGQQDTEYNYAAVSDAPEEMQGVSVFARTDEDEVFHTYSAYARGVESFNGAYQLLDLTPKGRDEDGLPNTMAWLRRHDEYTS